MKTDSAIPLISLATTQPEEVVSDKNREKPMPKAVEKDARKDIKAKFGVDEFLQKRKMETEIKR
ncbi:unnamed protein product [Gongylonema pulchrum]|uniref:Uncharacterized protein n=1 Tax=Gongylonema pulchrum TaxID=637853 RepID=A0A183F1H7_9BILA|nr:unnamed protein product [Gongylonema pulchrum]